MSGDLPTYITFGSTLLQSLIDPFTHFAARRTFDCLLVLDRVPTAFGPATNHTITKIMDGIILDNLF